MTGPRSTGRAGSRAATASTACGSTPADVRPTDDALAAIAEAEVIVLGPGSLYTSILPALLVPGIREAIAASGALVVFACNVATQPGETRGFDLADHVDALERHGLGHLPGRRARATTGSTPRRRQGWLGEPVRLRWPPASLRTGGPRLVLDDVVDPANAHHHDPAAARGRDHRASGRARAAHPPPPRASPAPAGRPDAGGWRAPTGTSSRRSAPSSRPSTRRAPATGAPRSRASDRTPVAREAGRRPARHPARRPRGPGRSRRIVRPAAGDVRLGDRAGALPRSRGSAAGSSPGAR